MKFLLPDNVKKLILLDKYECKYLFVYLEDFSFQLNYELINCIPDTNIKDNLVEKYCNNCELYKNYVEFQKHLNNINDINYYSNLSSASKKSILEALIKENIEFLQKILENSDFQTCSNLWGYSVNYFPLNSKCSINAKDFKTYKKCRKKVHLKNPVFAFPVMYTEDVNKDECYSIYFYKSSKAYGENRIYTRRFPNVSGDSGRICWGSYINEPNLLNISYAKNYYSQNQINLKAIISYFLSTTFNTDYLAFSPSDYTLKQAQDLYIKNLKLINTDKQICYTFNSNDSLLDVSDSITNDDTGFYIEL